MTINQSALLLSKLTKLVDISSIDEKTTALVQETMDKLADCYQKEPIGVPLMVRNALSGNPADSALLAAFTKQPRVYVQKPQSEDKEKVKQILSDFDPNKSEAWNTITERFGMNIKQPPLLEIAKIIGEHINISVNRNARRRKSVLIKWYHDNWALIKPFIGNFTVNDETVTLVKPLA